MPLAVRKTQNRLFSFFSTEKREETISKNWKKEKNQTKMGSKADKNSDKRFSKKLKREPNENKNEIKNRKKEQSCLAELETKIKQRDSKQYKKATNDILNDKKTTKRKWDSKRQKSYWKIFEQTNDNEIIKQPENVSTEGIKTR
jgi:hypothetical protein